MSCENYIRVETRLIASLQRASFTKDVTEALSLMQTEVKNRRDAQTLDTLAWALLRNGKHQEAMEYEQRIKVIEPSFDTQAKRISGIDYLGF